MIDSASRGVISVPENLAALLEESQSSELVGGTSLPVVDFQRRDVRSRFSHQELRDLQEAALSER
jgi:hypothetical protein